MSTWSLFIIYLSKYLIPDITGWCFCYSVLDKFSQTTVFYGNFAVFSCPEFKSLNVQHCCSDENCNALRASKTLRFSEALICQPEKYVEATSKDKFLRGQSCNVTIFIPGPVVKRSFHTCIKIGLMKKKKKKSNNFTWKCNLTSSCLMLNEQRFIVLYNKMLKHQQKQVLYSV